MAPPHQTPPRWLEFVQTGVADVVRELTNRTNAAVLLVRRRKRVFAFTFGHGRHLLKLAAVEPGFGLRTALNGLQPDSLRSLDSYVLEDQTVHTRTQASRASGIEAFGLDVGRDILRAVTGTPRPGLSVRSISGGEAALAISAPVDFPGLGPLCDELLDLYRQRTYREHFAWVDNVRRIRDPNVIEEADAALLADLRKGSDCSAYLAPPEPIEWEEVDGFAYTRRRDPIEPDVDIDHYLSVTDLGELEVEHLRKRDKVFVYRDGSRTPSDVWSIHKCLVFETTRGTGRRAVLTNGVWFEIEAGFAADIERSLKSIAVASIRLPSVNRLGNGKRESEREYNTRAAAALPQTALLDGTTARCRAASSGIEPCDLMTPSRDLVHVKHRKGGSSTLSHLFAQGRISAEALRSDEGFRAEVRALLRKIRKSWEDRVPLARPVTSDFQIVFAILGTSHRNPGPELPFFSQANLVRTSEALVSLGFRVGVLGVPISVTGASGRRKRR